VRSIRHFARNDARRIALLEKRVDRLVVALARYGTHERECKRNGFGAILDLLDGALTRSCSCGLTALIETRGEL